MAAITCALLKDQQLAYIKYIGKYISTNDSISIEDILNSIKDGVGDDLIQYALITPKFLSMSVTYKPEIYLDKFEKNNLDPTSLSRLYLNWSKDMDKITSWMEDKGILKKEEFNFDEAIEELGELEPIYAFLITKENYLKWSKVKDGSDFDLFVDKLMDSLVEILDSDAYTEKDLRDLIEDYPIKVNADKFVKFLLETDEVKERTPIESVKSYKGFPDNNFPNVYEAMKHYEDWVVNISSEFKDPLILRGTELERFTKLKEWMLKRGLSTNMNNPFEVKRDIEDRLEEIKKEEEIKENLNKQPDTTITEDDKATLSDLQDDLLDAIQKNKEKLKAEEKLNNDITTFLNENNLSLEEFNKYKELINKNIIKIEC